MSDRFTDRHTEQRLGVMAGLVAYSLWGLFPIYFKLIQAAVPTEGSFRKCDRCELPRYK